MAKIDLTGTRFGKLTVVSESEPVGWNRRFQCICDCGNETIVHYGNLVYGKTQSCGHCYKNSYALSKDGSHMVGRFENGGGFTFDLSDFDLIKTRTWYLCTEVCPYACDARGTKLHSLIIGPISEGFVIDHINLDSLDNRRSNLRICTRQQDQCNHDLQENNTSGVTGVSFYAPRKKYRARIKCTQLDIHLGYYATFLEAVQARNEAVRIMFGQFGIILDAPEAPPWIRKIVSQKCLTWLNLAPAYRGAYNTCIMTEDE